MKLFLYFEGLISKRKQKEVQQLRMQTGKLSREKKVEEILQTAQICTDGGGNDGRQ